MRTSSYSAVLLLLLASIPQLSAQTYTIKSMPPQQVGKSVTVRIVEDKTRKSKILDVDGKASDLGKSKLEDLVFTETILDRDDTKKKVTKFVRVYEKAKITEAGKTRPLSYEGRTLVFERSKDGVFFIGVVGKPLADRSDLNELIVEENQVEVDQDTREKALFPSKPVAVGETWKLDLKLIAEQMKLDCDIKASQGEGKLVKVEMRGNSLIGVLEFTLKLAVMSFPDLKFLPALIVVGKITMEQAIDGSRSESKKSSTMTMKGLVSTESEGQKFKLDFDDLNLQSSGVSAEVDDAKSQKIPSVEMFGPPGTWIEYTSKEGQYSVLKPGTPKVTVKKDEKSGDETVTAVVALDNGQVSYTVAYYSAQKNDPKELLAAFRKQFGEGAKKVTDVKLNGVDGIEVVSETKTKGDIVITNTIQVFVIDDRVYQLMAMNSSAAKEKLEVRKFLDSFKLIKKKDDKK